MNYVKNWVTHQAHVRNTQSDWWQNMKDRLEKEWKFAKRIAINVHGGEAEASKMFWLVTNNMLLVNDYNCYCYCCVAVAVTSAVM